MTSVRGRQWKTMELGRDGVAYFGLDAYTVPWRMAAHA